MKTKIFLISLVVSLPFWLGINILQGKVENFLFLKEISRNPELLKAEAMGQIKQDFLPQKKSGIPELEIKAKGVISILKTKNGEKKILFQKNIQEMMPVASLTKLMAADVILENFDLDQIVSISKDAVAQKEYIGGYQEGQTIMVRDLLFSSLLESSNDALYAITQAAGTEGFVALMNLEAKSIGLNNTFFVNPTGLDPEEDEELGNYSTPADLAELIFHILEKPLIKKIISSPEIDIYYASGLLHHKAVTTNQLLGSPLFVGRYKILGGKTGKTEKAKGCLIIVMIDSESGNYIINVILGSDNRFGEMEKLINWLNQAYQWQ